MVTETVLVYRKRTDRQIEWNIRYHPDEAAVDASRVDGEHEQINVWAIQPVSQPRRSSVFSEVLVERVVRYWPFVGDPVLDPFTRTGTVGRVAGRMGLRFVLVEKDHDHFQVQLDHGELMAMEPKVVA